MTIYQPSICHKNSTTTLVRGDADDEDEDGLHDEHPQRMGVKQPQRVSPLDELAFYRTHHFISPTTEVSYDTGRSLQ